MSINSINFSSQDPKVVLTPATVVNKVWTDQGAKFSSFGAVGIAVNFTLKPHATLDIDVLKWRVMFSGKDGVEVQEQKYGGDVETISVREHKFNPIADSHLDLTTGVTEVSAYFNIDPAGFEFCQLQIYSEDTDSTGIPTVEVLEFRRLS